MPVLLLPGDGVQKGLAPCLILLNSASTVDREMVTETLTSLKNTLDDALDRAAQGGKMVA